MPTAFKPGTKELCGERQEQGLWMSRTSRESAVHVEVTRIQHQAGFFGPIICALSLALAKDNMVNKKEHCALNETPIVLPVISDFASFAKSVITMRNCCANRDKVDLEFVHFL